MEREYQALLMGEMQFIFTLGIHYIWKYLAFYNP